VSGRGEALPLRAQCDAGGCLAVTVKLQLLGLAQRHHNPKWSVATNSRPRWVGGFFCMPACLPACLSACLLAGSLACWLACWLAGLLACGLACLLGGLLAGWLAGLLAGFLSITSWRIWH
jgi:hypothetical protein